MKAISSFTRAEELESAKKGAKKASKTAKKEAKAAKKAAQKARTRDSLQALSKLGELVDGRYRIVSQPPIVVPARELDATYGIAADEFQNPVHEHSAPTGPPCKTTGASCWSAEIDMAHRSWASAASGRERSSSAQGRDQQDHCSCRSRKATASCSKTIYRRVATNSLASAS